MKRTTIGAIVVLIIVTALLGLGFAKYGTGPLQYLKSAVLGLPSATSTVGSGSGTIGNVTDALVAQSPDYSAANESWQKGDFSTALQQYQSSLTTVSNPVLVAQVKYMIGKTSEQMNNFSTAINQYKQIAGDPASGNKMRAYAVQAIAAMHNNHFDNPDIASTTFSGEPYASFLQGGNLALAYRRLFEYAASFYPLGYSESWIANWYANDLVYTLKGATTTTQGQADIAAVNHSLQLADADVAATLTDPVSGNLDPATLAREGADLGLLTSVGAGDPQQVEQYFKAAIQAAMNFDEPSGGFVPFNYASFLINQYGSSRVADIRSVLAPYHVGGEVHIMSNVVEFFRSSRIDPTLSSQRKMIINLANMAPDFKTYLQSIGWSASDFAS